jgi:hypothetical protein
MDNDAIAELSKKLNVLIALAIKQLLAEKSFVRGARSRAGVSEIVHYLADMGLEAKDISEIVGSPITSVRTLLTPGRRK